MRPKPGGPLRVLEIVRQLDYGGGEQYVNNLTGRLDKERFIPHVIGYSGGAIEQQLRGMGIPCEIIKLNLWAWPRIVGYIKKEGIDLVHGHGTKGALMGVLAAKATGIPFIYTEHGWSFHEKQSFPRRLFSIIIENIICILADRVICVSNEELKKMRILLGVNSAKVQIVRHGIDTGVFDPGLFVETHLQKVDKFIIAMIGRVTIQKNPFCFLRVAGMFRDNARCEFRIIGDGDLLGRIKKEKDDAGLQNLLFYPPTRNVPQLLNEIDCLIAPSFWEAGPLNVLEAMAMGKTCIVSDVGLAKEIIKNGENGFIVQRDSTASLESQIEGVIKELLRRPDLKKHIEGNARAIIAENYRIEDMVSAVQRIYEQTA